MNALALKKTALSKALVSEAKDAGSGPITERIAIALQGPTLSSAVLQPLWDEAYQARSAAGAAEGDAMKRALDPSISVAEARAARHDAEDFAHEGRRLEAAMASIDEVLPTVVSLEHKAAIMPAYLAHKAKRAALVERIRKEWPKLTTKMIDLIEAIETFRQSPAVEIPEGHDPLRIDVEAEARGCDSSFYAPPYHGAGVQPVLRLRDARIPRFEPSSAQGSKYAWPRGA